MMLEWKSDGWKERKGVDTTGHDVRWPGVPAETEMNKTTY